MNRSTLAGGVAACIFFFGAGVGFAAQPPAADPTAAAPGDGKAVAAEPAEACLKDLHALDAEMDKDGYWAGGAGFGYGYPMDGIPTGSESNFRNVRPSYELRTLIASASILAQRGQQQTCEDVLGTIRIVFKAYVAQMHGAGGSSFDAPDRRQLQIAAAQPIAARSEAFRSDQLLGTEVRNPQNESLGVVHDLVLRPKTGAIAYLVIGRGGFFGIDERYVPVPWAAFRVTQDLSLLVLDARTSVMADAPQVAGDAFAANGQFDQESQKVDAWWKAHPAVD